MEKTKHILTVYTDKFNYIHNLPALFTVLTFAFLASMVGVGATAFYSRKTSLACYFVLGITGVCCFAVWVWLRVESSKWVRKYWSTHSSRRESSVPLN